MHITQTEHLKLTGKVLERVKLIKPGYNWKSLPKYLQTGSKHSGAYGRLDPNKPSRTLTTRFDTPPGGYVTHPTENRAITVAIEQAVAAEESVLQPPRLRGE